MSGRFTDRVAIVTGGVSGIGAGIAARLAAEGARVSLWDRDAAALAKAGAAHTRRGRCHRRRRGAARRRRHRRRARPHRHPGRLAPASPDPTPTVWDYPVADWDRVIDVNLNGVFYCNRAVVPHMLRNGYGRIVNIASIAGKEGNPNASAYSASKAGVIGADQVARQGTRQDRHPGQLRHPGRGAHAAVRRR